MCTDTCTHLQRKERDACIRTSLSECTRPAAEASSTILPITIAPRAPRNCTLSRATPTGASSTSALPPMHTLPCLPPEEAASAAPLPDARASTCRKTALAPTSGAPTSGSPLASTRCSGASALSAPSMPAVPASETRSGNASSV